MNRAHLYMASLFLVGALAAPVTVMANATPQASVQVRVYDRDHKDYHNWDDREDHSYRLYLTGRHKEYRSYDHQSHREQRRYWNWRHSHPDND
jgi:hypothetical protein